MTQDELLQYLRSHDITYHLYTHEPLFTCEQAAPIIEQLAIPGASIKNLFLKDSKKQLYHIVALSNSRIDLKLTGKMLGAKELRFADANLLMHHLSVEPGSVTPLALINDQEKVVQVIIDEALFTHHYIQVHPLKNTATITLTPADLLRFFNVCNRTYTIYNFETHQIVSL